MGGIEMEIIIAILGAMGVGSVTSAITSELLARKNRAAAVSQIRASTAEVYQRISDNCAKQLELCLEHTRACALQIASLTTRLAILEQTVNGKKDAPR